jgi:hypothetical protein
VRLVILGMRKTGDSPAVANSRDCAARQPRERGATRNVNRFDESEMARQS